MILMHFTTTQKVLSWTIFCAKLNASLNSNLIFLCTRINEELLGANHSNSNTFRIFTLNSVITIDTLLEAI